MSTVTLEFGVKPSALVAAATRLTMVGTASIKAGKLTAAAAILSGADSDDVSLRTGVKGSALRRVVAIVNNGRKPINGAGAVTAAAASDAIHGIDWAVLTADASADNWAAQYDATIDAANVWDRMFADISAGGKGEPDSLSDIIIKASNALADGVNDGRWNADTASEALINAAAALEAVVAERAPEADAA